MRAFDLFWVVRKRANVRSRLSAIYLMSGRATSRQI